MRPTDYHLEDYDPPPPSDADRIIAQLRSLNDKLEEINHRLDSPRSYQIDQFMEGAGIGFGLLKRRLNVIIVLLLVLIVLTLSAMR